MGEMPRVAVFEPDPRQIRPDASGAEEVRHVVGVFTGLAHRTPAARLAGHRTHVLGMAIPATLEKILAAAELLQRRIICGFGHHPFELAQIGPDDRGYPVGAR